MANVTRLAVGRKSGAANDNAPSAPPQLVVTLTVDEFDARIEAAAARALDAQQPRPKWLDLDGIANHYGVSTPTIRSRCDEGMPHIYVGTHRRFDSDACDAWHRERAQKTGG